MTKRKHVRPVQVTTQKPSREEIIENIKALENKLRLDGTEKIVGRHEDGTAIVEGKHGGKQSFLPYRADLLDGYAMKQLAAVLKHGSKYGINNWRKIPRQEHLNHAFIHLFNVLDHYHGTNMERIYDVEEELEHALCRVMMAVATGWDTTE